MNETTHQPYRVHRGGPKAWYVQEVATGELKALPFATRKAAQNAASGWNERRKPSGELVGLKVQLFPKEV